MDKILKWIEKNKKITVVFCCILIFLPIIAIHFLFKIKTGCYLIEAEWEPGDILGYFGDVLSFLGTVVLGYVAISQTEKANNLNEELLNIEKRKVKPCVDIQSTHLYKIYLSDDMYKSFSEKERVDRMTIELLYTNKPRTGITTDCALLELDVTNSGGSDIRKIYVKHSEFYLCVRDPYSKNEKLAIMTGNSSLNKGETRTLFVYVKREINCVEEMSNKWYEEHMRDLMPHMEFEFVLETMSGERYLEKIVCDSGWDASMQDVGKTATRQIGVSQIEVKEIKE